MIIKPDNYPAIMREFHVQSLLAKALCTGDPRRLFGQDPHDFYLLKDSRKAVTRIRQAIASHEKTVIYGDYDCDGIMATTILMRALGLLGLNCGYHIPDRFQDGYGLNKERVRQMIKKGYSLIITVDNGISAYEACDLAMANGIDVIITDHHALPEKLPPAYAILHTGLSDDYPFKEISGGLLACKLACALLEKQDPYLQCLAAISTVSDMMPMLDENRTLVKAALRDMNSRHYQSIDMLVPEAKVIGADTIGYQIAPRVNAVGRMNLGMSANQCVRYFMSPEAKTARDREFKLAYVKKSEEINQKRQELTALQVQKAKSIMTDVNGALVAKDDDFHEGIIGLVAGRLTKEYYQPSFVLCASQDNYKGSARGIPGISIYQLLKECSPCLETFGGHESAGGFSLKKSNYEPFINYLNIAMRKYQGSDVWQENKPAVLIAENDCTMDKIRELEVLKPYGQKNPAPLFCLPIEKFEKVAWLSGGQHLKATCMIGHQPLDLLWFHHEYDPDLEKKLKNNGCYAIGELSLNEYRGRVGMQMILKEID